MNYEQMKQAVIKYATAENITDYDIYYTSGASTTIYSYEGEIDNFSDRTSMGLCFRCIIDGKTGYSHTQLLSDEEAKRLVSDAKDCAKIIENDEFSIIFSGSDSYQKIEIANDTNCDINNLKQLAINIEKKAKALDSRIVSVPYAVTAFGYGEVAMYNSKGLDLYNKQKQFDAVCQVIAEQDGVKYIGTDSKTFLHEKDLSIDEVVQNAVNLAINSIGGKSVPSGEYPIIFSNNMMSTMISCFTDIFSADSANKGLSLLKDKEGEKIASDIFTLTDDPFYSDSPNKTSFDDEGVATYKKNIIENGILNTLLYDLESASKSNKKSTGNGVKYSYSSKVNIQPFTICVKPGNNSLEDLFNQEKKALYITELKGMHASANPTTGDFALEAKGMLVDDGKISRPAEQFTISGNFYKMIQNITSIANDLKLNSGVASPSVLVKSLNVAGE